MRYLGIIKKFTSSMNSSFPKRRINISFEKMNSIIKIGSIKSEMYLLAIVGLLTTVISAFYYLRIIKIIYFDETKILFDDIK